MVGIPKLSYPITRDFRWRWFTPTVAAVVLVALAFLIPLNYALTGYQEVIWQDGNFNATQLLWYHKLLPQRLRPQPGSQCEPHIFSIGDTFTTNHSIFAWQIQNVQTQTVFTTQYSGFSYIGLNLDSCDVVSMALDANFMSISATFSAGINCLANGIPITASTSFNVGFSSAGSLLFNVELRPKTLNMTDPSFQSDLVLTSAAEEVIMNLQSNLYGSNWSDTTPISLSANWDANDTGICPPIMQNAANPLYCIDFDPYAPPVIDFDFDLFGVLKGFPGEFPDMQQYYNATVHNAFQVLHAAVRLDLGYALPNNLFTNTTAVISANKTIIPEYPYAIQLPAKNLTEPANSKSSLYGELAGTTRLPNGDPLFKLPLDGSKKSVVSVPFSCHFVVRKSGGEALVLTFAATMTMLGTGWGLFMWLATKMAMWNEPENNFCDGHYAPLRPNVELGYASVDSDGRVGDNDDPGTPMDHSGEV